MSGGECVKVIVRCRPMNGKEKALHCAKIITIDQNALSVSIIKPRILGSELAAGQTTSNKSASESSDYEPKRFTYDGVYDDDSNQKEVYEDTAYPLLQSVMEGYNGTIFAYGQTGCGKTFTMEGVRNIPELRGIIPTTFNQLFTSIDAAADGQKQFLVRASYIEIYNEEVRDLMSDNPKARCEVKEDKDKGVYIKGLINTEVKCESDLEAVMSRGNSNRTVGATLMNADSSRSHSIFTITIECSEPDTIKGGDEVKIRQGKLNLVDLAGSERQSKTQAEGVRLKEATKINLSLSALGNVIEALVANAGGKGRHIPYRDSKLTRLLQDSLGGNTKTVMIAAISPADYNFEETLSTLRYANRAKNIKNKPVINEDPKDALLREYQDEIKRLKLILEEKGLGDLLSSMTKLTGGAPAKSMAAIKAPSSASSSKKATTTDVDASREDTAEAVAVALTGAESEKRAAAHEEFEEDLNRLSDEKHQHERLAAVIGLEMETRAQEVAEIVKEKTEIEQRIEAEAAKGKTQVVALLQQEKERLEVESAIKQQEQTDIQQRMMAEKQEHESMALSLQQEMQQRLDAEAQRRQELEMKYHFIQDKTEKEKQALQQKLQLLQTKLLKGSNKIKNIQQEQQEEKIKIKLKEKEVKRQALLLKEQQVQYEEDSLFIEEKYNNIQDANDSISRKIRLIAKKYKSLEQEKIQLEDELEQHKEIHIRDIREADKETKLYRQIVYLLLTETDIDKIIKNAEWLDGREQWKLPAIDLPLIFPSIRVASKQLSLPSHKSQSPNTTTTSNQSPRQQQQLQPQERAKSRWGNKSPIPIDTPQQQQISSIPSSTRPMSNSIMSRLHLHDYRSYEQNALDRSLYSTAPHAITMGTTPSWRKSAAISRLSSEELEAMAGERVEQGRQQSRPRGNSTTAISAAEAAQKAAELTENLENIIGAVRRREVFQPTKVIEETKEEYETDDDHNNNNNNNSSIINDSAIKKRPAFQPAKIVTNMEKDITPTSLLPDSAFNVPSRPAFNPTSPTPTSPATPGTTIDINNLPKGRPAFTPAKIA